MSSAIAGNNLKVMFLLPFAPRLDATNGGSRVMAQFLHALSTHAGPSLRMGLLYLRGEQDPPLDEKLHACVEWSEEVTRPRSGASLGQQSFRLAYLALAWLRGNPLWVADWSSPAFAERVRSRAQQWEPDIVQLDYHVMGQYLPALDGCRGARVLVEHEPGSRTSPYLKGAGSWLAGLLHRRDLAAWQRYELPLLRQVQAVVAFTREDQRSLAHQAGSTPVLHIPFGTELPEHPANPTGSQPPVVLFSGSFTHPPNVEAALRLGRSIFPQVSRALPDAVLTIVGEQPTLPVRSLAGEKIRVTGRVPDLAPYLGQAAVVVAPLFSGGGMRVKVMEALAAGKAIVATPLAVEGLEGITTDQISLVESDAQAAEAIVALLRDPERRRRLAENGRAWALIHLGWERAVEDSLQLYRSLLPDSGRGSGFAESGRHDGPFTPMDAGTTGDPDTLRPLLQSLFQAFDDSRARWSVLRLPREACDPGTSGGDADLLASPSDLPSLHPALKQLEFIRLPGWEQGEHYLHYQPENGQWTWVHLVTQLDYGPYGLLKTGAAAGCLERRQRSRRPGYQPPVLAADDAFWELLLHCLIEKQAIALRHRGTLQLLASVACPDGPLALQMQTICPPGWDTDRIVSAVCNGEWERVESLRSELKTRWMQRAGVRRRRIWAQQARRLVRRLVNVRRMRGAGVAVLGPDGAGKSNLISEIRDNFLLPTRTVYMGLTGGLLRYVDRLVLPPLVVPGHLLVFWGRFMLAKYHQYRGRLVIFDRYLYDWRVPTPQHLNHWKRAMRWIDGHSCPGPDLALVLDAPGEVMFRRKGEYNPEMLEDWRQHYLALKNDVPGVEVVDATQSKEALRNQAIHLIWQRYQERWNEAG